MKVRELIERLGRMNPEAAVLVWDAEFDHETDRVFVSPMMDGTVMVTDVDFEAVARRMAAPREPGGLKWTERLSRVAPAVTGNPPA